MFAHLQLPLHRVIDSAASPPLRNRLCLLSLFFGRGRGGYDGWLHIRLFSLFLARTAFPPDDLFARSASRSVETSHELHQIAEAGNQTSKHCDMRYVTEINSAKSVSWFLTLDSRPVTSQLGSGQRAKIKYTVRILRDARSLFNWRSLPVSRHCMKISATTAPPIANILGCFDGNAKYFALVGRTPKIF